MLVRFTVDARDAVREKRAWWEQHRDEAPHLFRDELKTAVAHLRRAPVEGARRYAIRGNQVIWRLLMPKTRHHLYFRVNEAKGEVEVLTLWNARGRADPDFSSY